MVQSQGEKYAKIKGGGQEIAAMISIPMITHTHIGTMIGSNIIACNYFLATAFNFT